MWALFEEWWCAIWELTSLLYVCPAVLTVPYCLRPLSSQRAARFEGVFQLFLVRCVIKGHEKSLSSSFSPSLWSKLRDHLREGRSQCIISNTTPQTNVKEQCHFLAETQIRRLFPLFSLHEPVWLCPEVTESIYQHTSSSVIHDIVTLCLCTSVKITIRDLTLADFLVGAGTRGAQDLPLQMTYTL